jgi:hypothetical protein
MHDLLATKLVGEQKAHALDVQNCALSLLDTSNDVTKLLRVYRPVPPPLRFVALSLSLSLPLVVIQLQF